MKSLALKFFVFSSFLFLSGNSFGATYYSRANDNWNKNTTWSTAGCGGAAATSFPGAGDVAIICAGYIVNGNNNFTVLDLVIDGTLNWSAIRTITVTGNLVMNGGTITGTKTGILNVSGTFTNTATNNIGRGDLTVLGTSTISSIVNLTSTQGALTFSDIVITGTLSNVANTPIFINGNLTNNGTYTVGSGAVTFGGVSGTTITGSSATGFSAIIINKGTDNSSILDVQSLITLTAGGLTLTNGTFKLSNTGISITPFSADITVAPYLIPSTAGLWCNGATINSGNLDWTVAGLVRVSSGTINLGNTANNDFIVENSGTTQLTIEGGNVNIAGNITKQGAGDFLTFNMSGGTLTVPTVGSSAAGVSPFSMDEASGSFTMSSGTIIIERAGMGNQGFTGSAGTYNIMGGTLQVGDASTPTSQTIGINTIYPIANLAVSSSNATAQLSAALTVLQNISVNSGTLNANNFNISLGNSWTNSGTWVPGTGTVTLNGTGAQTITKTGGETFNNFTVNKSTGTVVLANNVQVNSTLTMTSGNIVCGVNTLTLGISTASAGTLSYTAGTIVGVFNRWKNSAAGSLLFPTGTSSYYRPVTVNFTTVVGGTLSAGFVESNPGSSGLPLSESGKSIIAQFTEGYWNMTAANGLSSTNYAINLNGNGFASYSVVPSTRVLYRTGSGNPWTLNGTHVDAVGTTAQRSGVSGATAQFGFGKLSCSSYSAVSVTGVTPVCTNDAGVSYSVTGTAGNSYTWVITGGAQASGGTSSAITVNWGAVGMIGNVRVTEANDCGDNNTPIDFPVVINPIATSAISGVTDVSTNEAGVAYSVTNNTGYTYNWTIVGGTQVSGGTTNAITVNWGPTPMAGSVSVTVTRICGGPDSPPPLSVNIRSPFYSRANGNWDAANTWSSTCGGAAGTAVPGPNDEVIICAGNTIIMRGNPGTCRKLTMNGTANWTQVRTTNVGSGGIIINSSGNITGVVAGILTSTGGLTLNSNSNITSTTVTIRLQTSAQNISSTGTPGSLNILDITTTATNTGTLVIANGGTLSGAGTLTQGTNATLRMNGTNFSLSTLNASASGNTVEYGANASQNVRPSTYYHLKLSGSGTKTLAGATAVTGDLTITAVSLDVGSPGNYALSVGGNWTNTGTFVARGGTVTFNGLAAQLITKSGGETFNNLVMSGAGTKTLANNINIDFDFSLVSTLSAGSNLIGIRGNFNNSGTYNATAGNVVTFTNSSAITGLSPTQFIDIIVTGSLTGHSDNFRVSGNWTNNGTFNHNNGTVIFNGTTAIGGTSATTFKNISITGTLNAPAANMNIAGDFSNAGTFNHNSGTLTFNGSSAQAIQGTNTFNNITIDNSFGGVGVTSGVQSLINTLTLSSGNFSTNNNLILVSDASATARIAPITGGSISGDVTMQRYIPAGNTSWRQLASAVSGQTLANWHDDFPMVGFTGVSSSNFVSVQTYNETVLGVKENGWVPATNVTNPIVVGKGYMCYVGDGPTTTNPIYLDVKSTINSGSIALPVTYTSSAGPTEDGWNLVANPYPSNILWDNNPANWSKANLSNTIAVWNPASQNYAQYTIGGPDPGPNGGRPYINSSQAFWVQTTGAAPSLTINETAKDATAPPFFKQGGDPDVLKLKIKSSNGFSDEAFIQFKNNSDSGFDTEDGPKFFSSYDVPHIASVISDSNDASLNTLPGLSDDQVIPLRVGGKAKFSVGGGKFVCNKTFTISAYNLEKISMSACIILEDTKTGILTNLRDTSYSFTISDTALANNSFVPSLDAAPRFFVHVGGVIEKSSSGGQCNGSSEGIAIAKGKGSGPWSYAWKDEMNSLVRVTSQVNTADTLMNVPPGTYTVEISGNSGFCETLMDTVIIPGISSAISLVKDVVGASCYGTSDGEITLFVSGEFPPFSFQWNTGATQDKLTGLSSHDYSVTVSDSSGCSISETFNVFQPEEVVSSFFTSDTVYLSEGGNAFFQNNSTGYDVLAWDFGDGSPPDSSSNPVHTYSQEGIFSVELKVFNEWCGDGSSIKQVVVLPENSNVGLSGSPGGSFSVKVFQHDRKITIQVTSGLPPDRIVLHNSLGQTVYQSEGNSGPESTIATHSLSGGIYFLSIYSGGKSFKQKIELMGHN